VVAVWPCEEKIKKIISSCAAGGEHACGRDLQLQAGTILKKVLVAGEESKKPEKKLCVRGIMVKVGW
jgi:hypothetical protein